MTASSIAPGSVSSTALAKEHVVTKSLADVDQIAHNGEWTGSELAAAMCGQGEDVPGTGFAFANPTNGESTWLQVLPIVNAEATGVSGRFMSDAGGSAEGVVAVVCLPK